MRVAAPRFSPAVFDRFDRRVAGKDGGRKMKKKRRRVRDIHASMIVSGASALRIEFAGLLIARIVEKIDASFTNANDKRWLCTGEKFAARKCSVTKEEREFSKRGTRTLLPCRFQRDFNWLDRAAWLL